MKLKYKLYNDLLFDEAGCIDYLEKQALKGWVLEKVGTSFFKFRKQAPLKLKYQLDYNPLTDEYLDLVAIDGYRYIDNFRNINFFVNENYEASDIQSDKVSKLMVQKKVFPLWQPIILMISTLIIYVISDFIGYFGNNSWGYFFVESNVFLAKYLFKLVAGTFLLDAIGQMLIRYNIYLKYNDKRTIDKLIKRVFKLEQVVMIIMSPLILLMLISNVLIEPNQTIKFALIMAVIFTFSYYINKKSYQEVDSVKKRMKFVVVFVLWMIIFIGIQNLDFSSKKQVPLSNLQSAKIIDASSNSSLFVKSTIITGSDDSESEYKFTEVKYTCLNNTIAREVFKYQIRDIDQQLRIPSEEEIEQIVDKTGEWSTNDVEYLSFEKARDNLIKYDTTIVDECYYSDNIYVAIKNEVVLVTKVLTDTSIDKVLGYYFK